MKKKILFLLLLLPISFGGLLQVGHAKVDSLHQPANKQITEKEAEEIALKKVKGDIVRVKLEEDDGKSVYEVKVKSAGIIYEVEIDASTGQVLEVEKEGAHNGDDDRHGDDDGDDDGNGDDDHLDD